MILRALLMVAAATTVGIAQETDEAVSTRVEVGKKAPDFAMTNIDGKEVQLSEKLGKEKNVVLMFSRAHW